MDLQVFSMNGEALAYLIGTVQALLLLPVIWFVRTERPLNRFLFMLMVLAIGINFSESLFYATPALYLSWPDFLGWVYPVSFLIPPLFYLYLRSHLFSAFSLTWIQLPHALPALLACIPAAQFLWLPMALKQQLYQDNLMTEPDLDIFTIIEAAQISGYLLASYRITLRFNLWLREVYAFEEKINARWLLWGLGYMSAVTVAYLLNMFWGLVNNLFFAVVYVIAVYLLGIMAIRHSLALREVVQETPIDDPPATPKQYVGSINSGEQARIKLALQQQMTEHHRFLDPYLNLDRLAEHIGAHPNNVSRTINELFQQNFFEYINGLRIQHCQQLLISAPGQSILDVAMASGFNSKSAFYATFKQVCGMTPSEYRKYHLNATS